MLAMDRPPHTEREWEIWNVIRSLERHDSSTFDPEATDYLLRFGMQLARAVRDGKSQEFLDWAKAIDEWKNYKPNPDPLRIDILNYMMFHASPESLAKPISDRTYTVEDILAYLKAKNKKKYPLDEKATRKAIYRIRDEWGFTIKGTPGRRWTTSK